MTLAEVPHLQFASLKLYAPGSKLLIFWMVIPPLVGNPYNGYINLGTLSFLALGILSHLPMTCFVNLVPLLTSVLTSTNVNFGTKVIPMAITLLVSTSLPFVFTHFCLVRLLTSVFLMMILFRAPTKLFFFVHNGSLNYHCLMLYLTVCLLPSFPPVIIISPSPAI